MTTLQGSNNVLYIAHSFIITDPGDNPYTRQPDPKGLYPRYNLAPDSESNTAPPRALHVNDPEVGATELLWARYQQHPSTKCQE